MSAFRLEIKNTVKDTRALMRLKRLQASGYNVQKAQIVDVYTITRNFSDTQKNKIGTMLTNPLFEEYTFDSVKIDDFDYAIEIGFLPGVTDNVAHTVTESIEDLLKTKLHHPDEAVYFSQITFLRGNLDRKNVEIIANSMANSLIQRIHIKSREEFEKDGGMDLLIPKVDLHHTPRADEVNLEISDKELIELGKKGIKNTDGTFRGPLALSLNYLTVIREYFRKEGRNPTDVELEAIAQTWSEHCKHTIFADPMDEIEDGIYRHYIKRATQEVRKQKGENDFCISVFSDNAGGIIFDDEYLVADKVETHNSPSALDPFGGAITGIVGVNRDVLGFGKGAKPILNRYFFCFGDIDDERPLYRGKNKKNPALSSRQIMEGVVEGVYTGGNESGIPTPQGGIYFESRYRGKPLVFAGTVGLIPQKVGCLPSAEKSANPGDLIVMSGGKVGLDGIHGATFSSEALDTGSPATAVQIGDPITQKKMSDALVKEARDLGLYNSITDCGAGGISCSVAEMARECGGCVVDLEKVPLKYPNISPWEIWISESQERMTMSVLPEKADELLELFLRRGVNAWVIGKFTKEPRCQVKHNGEMIVDLDMEFLHNGLPQEHQKTEVPNVQSRVLKLSMPTDLTQEMLQMIGRKNIASYEFISLHYDHNVQGSGVIGPLQGKGRVNGSASVSAPVLGNSRGVVLSQALNPKYSDLDTYHMATCAIDTAIRQSVAVGANPEYLALLDNFCWCSSHDPKRLGQLKEAARGCYESATAYGTPFISGKDSMFNDFKGFDENENPVTISVPPTLLISSIGVIEDVQKCISLDVKFPGDLMYIIGETKNELGGSEYAAMHEQIGEKAPQVNTEQALKRYKFFYAAGQKGLISAAITPAIGGLGTALMKMAIGGQLGMEIDLREVPYRPDATTRPRDDYLIFSESQSRFAVSVDPKKQKEFESALPEAKLVGKVTDDQKITITGLSGEKAIDSNVDQMTQAYRSPFQSYV